MSKITRRDFLRVTLSSTALAAIGCSKSDSNKSPDIDARQDTTVDQPPSNASDLSAVGEIGICGFNYAMIGWLACDGSEYNINDYPELFSVIGTTYGGDGTQVFRVPDLRGRALAGVDETLLLGGQTSRIDPSLEEEPPVFSYTSALFVIATGRY